MNTIIGFKNLIFIFMISLVLCFLVHLLFLYLIKFGRDKIQGIQKIHSSESTRISGLPIILSVIISLTILEYNTSFFYLTLLCFLPIFIIGFAEDLSGQINIISRLIPSIFSAILLVIIFKTTVNKVDFFYLNQILSIPLFAFTFTILGLVGTSNGLNFIDGINGLASGISIVILFTLSQISHQIGFYDLATFLIIVSICVLSFWILNLTLGNIFLGDGGSYFLGMLIAWAGIQITSFNDKVSAWSIFFLIIYIATELTVSVTRRIYLRTSPFNADNLHLHSLLYQYLKLKYPKKKKVLNSLSGIILTIFGSLPSIILLIFDVDFQTIMLLIIIFVFSFILVYLYLIKILKNYS